MVDLELLENLDFGSVSDEVVTGFVTGAIFGFIIALAIVASIIQIVAYFKIFKKAGEKPWKAFIPVYSTYILFKISWDTSKFWLLLLVSFASGLVAGFLGEETVGYLITEFILSIFVIVFQYKLATYLAESFKKSKRFAMGLFFFPWVFLLILGYGNAKYKKLNK